MNRSVTPLVSGWRTKAKLGVRPRKAIWFWKGSDIKALPWSWRSKRPRAAHNWSRHSETLRSGGATAQAKAGNPEVATINIEGMEKVIPIIIEDCKKAPQDSFWQKLEAGWKRVEADMKSLEKKL